jgi:fructose-bisphosphate aldolase class 1
MREMVLETFGTMPSACISNKHVSGAILFEETLYQSTVHAKKIVDILNEQGIVPGIKVDKVRIYILYVTRTRLLAIRNP